MVLCYVGLGVNTFSVQKIRLQYIGIDISAFHLCNCLIVYYASSVKTMSFFHSESAWVVDMDTLSNL